MDGDVHDGEALVEYVAQSDGWQRERQAVGEIPEVPGNRFERPENS